MYVCMLSTCFGWLVGWSAALLGSKSFGSLQRIFTMYVGGDDDDDVLFFWDERGKVGD